MRAIEPLLIDFSAYAFTLFGRKAGMTPGAKRVTCSLDWLREAPNGKAMRTYSKPGCPAIQITS